MTDLPGTEVWMHVGLQELLWPFKAALVAQAPQKLHSTPALAVPSWGWTGSITERGFKREKI